jgi:hypothetical protein
VRIRYCAGRRLFFVADDVSSERAANWTHKHRFFARTARARRRPEVTSEGEPTALTDTHRELESYDISGLRLMEKDAVQQVGPYDLSTYTPSWFPATTATFDGMENLSERHAKCPPWSLIAVLVPFSWKHIDGLPPINTSSRLNSAQSSARPTDPGKALIWACRF